MYMYMYIKCIGQVESRVSIDDRVLNRNFYLGGGGILLKCYTLRISWPTYEAEIEQGRNSHCTWNCVHACTYVRTCIFTQCTYMYFLSLFQARGGEMETVTFTRPLDSRLEHVDLSLLFNTLNPRKIIQLFSSILMERRIILCSSNLRYGYVYCNIYISVFPLE